MRDGTISVDRREQYYVDVAPLVRKDPLWFYTRAERGRRIQRAIRPVNLSLLQLHMAAAERAALKCYDDALFDLRGTGMLRVTMGPNGPLAKRIPPEELYK